AGPEIGVASTKAFSTMIVATYLLGLWLGRQRGAITAEDVKKRIHDLLEIPRLVEKTLELDGQIAALARELGGARGFLYLGRRLQDPSRDRSARLRRSAGAAHHGGPAAAPRVPHRGAAGLRRGPAPEPRQERHGRVALSSSPGGRRRRRPASYWRCTDRSVQSTGASRAQASTRRSAASAERGRHGR